MPTLETKAAIRVIAPARLHLGFLDLNGGLGRRYGSIGLAVDKPATELTLQRSTRAGASGAEQERAAALVQRFAKYFGLPGDFTVDVVSAIPAHAGLGSGTQLALATGAAMMRLAGLAHDPRSLGELVDRGARSAIGMASFTDGGFIIDGGRGGADRAPPVIVRTPFPEAWRALLVLDKTAVGVHGDRETKAFATLREFPLTTAAHLCHLTLLRLLPGLVEQDLTLFGRALTEIQEVVGGHFAGAQGGGIWSSENVGRLIKRMGDLGAKGLGQSSWGPTGFAFVESQDAANKLFHTLGEEAKGLGLEILIVHGRNSGAQIFTGH
ncbi:MAG: GHMP kinase [Hyphomicrobiaceae bacterium]|nr:GHMP kinase [Hyphomicrobiaceae bacterium]